MRHNVSGKKLSRSSAHRKALLRNLSTSLVKYGSIETTLAKAKYVRPYVEKLVTKAKAGDTNAVRRAKKDLFTEEMVRKLVKEVAPKFLKRNGGYTRIRRLGKRDGDNAQMARIEWVSFDVEAKKPTPKKTKAVSKTPAKAAAAKKRIAKSKEAQ